MIPLIWPYRTDFDLYLAMIPDPVRRDAIRYAYGCFEPHYYLPAIRYELRTESDFFGYGAVVFIRQGRGDIDHLIVVIYATEDKP